MRPRLPTTLASSALALGPSVDAIPVERLVGPGVVVDASARRSGGPGCLVGVPEAVAKLRFPGLAAPAARRLAASLEPGALSP